MGRGLPPHRGRLTSRAKGHCRQSENGAAPRLLYWGMPTAESSRTFSARAGWTFVVLLVGSFVLLGELMGSFADPDRQFVALFSRSGDRLAFIAGSVLLLLAGLVFVWFAHAVSREAGQNHLGLLITGVSAAGGMIVAALAFATVPLSIQFGSITGDPGLESGQAVLPQLGYVAFGLGAMVPAALFIAIAARTPGLLPRWLAVSSYPVSVLVALTAFLFMPVVLFVLWVAASTASISRRRRP